MGDFNASHWTQSEWNETGDYGDVLAKHRLKERHRRMRRDPHRNPHNSDRRSPCHVHFIQLSAHALNNEVLRLPLSVRGVTILCQK